MIDDRVPCICGHWEDRHTFTGCEADDCVCDAYIADVDGEAGMVDLMQRLQGGTNDD